MSSAVVSHRGDEAQTAAEVTRNRQLGELAAAGVDAEAERFADLLRGRATCRSRRRPVRGR